MVGLDVYVGPRVGAAALASILHSPHIKVDATHHLLPALPALILHLAAVKAHSGTMRC